ncbi:MAG TPA: OmpA family protein [Kofleriaceae bacterium]
MASAGLVACATPQDKAACYPTTSWSLAPVMHCAPPAPPPAPPPPPEPVKAAEPPPEPAPPPKPTAKAGLEKIEMSETVQFENDSAVLLDRSKQLLDEVATVINDNADIKRLVIEGHTDSNATHAHNQKLSEQRVESVKAYLIGKGIDPKKLRTKAFGETKPIADNKTEEGRAQNRRVDFRIIERKKGK